MATSQRREAVYDRLPTFNDVDREKDLRVKDVKST